jgi:hypothetical protein
LLHLLLLVYVLWSLSPGRPQTMIFSISTSLLARITSLSHHTGLMSSQF